MVKVYIDAGHGGSDPGAIGIGGVREADINLAVSKHLKAELERHGIAVKMSRTSDTTKSLEARAAEANSWGADIVGSIHCNAFDEESANGTETWVYKFGSNAEKIAKGVNANLVSVLDTYNRGIKAGNLYMVRKTIAPAFLVELAFVSNKADCAKLVKDAYQKECAVAICKGICDYLGVTYKASEPTWVKDDKGWKYIKSDGTVTTNAWAKDSVGWCYLNSEGRAVKNAWKQINGRWYYFDNYCHAVKGMQKIDNHYFYFAEKKYDGIDECQLIITNDNGEIQI